MAQLSKAQIVILLVAVLALGMGAGVFLHSRIAGPSSSNPAHVVSTYTADLGPIAPQTINVYVTGAVIHPDVYSLPEGSIVKDAVTAAGGSTEKADLVGVNLAARLQDGDQIIVPFLSEEGAICTGVSPPGTSTIQTRISINRATAAELDTLPGIGPTKAQAIVEYRNQHGQFKRLEDLQKVKGIGTKTFEELKPFISL